MNRIKRHWNISSNTQLILILLVFAVNGSISGSITKPVMQFLNIHNENTHIILFWLIYFFIISIVYFTSLIIVSRIFGQHTFFRKFAKKSLSPLGFKWFFE